jgi:hypothetical protein
MVIMEKSKSASTAANVKPINRLVFFIILGFLSTFFAEVLSGSGPDFLLTGFGYFGIYPIYALHIILVSSLVIGRNKPFSLRTLFFASLLFGMYEAFITKVLWIPPWAPNAWRIGGIAVVEVIMLVPFWHSVMSFFIPLLWAESLMTSSQIICKVFPEKWKRRIFSFGGAILIGIFGSFFIGSEIASASEAFSLAFINITITTILILLWKIFSGGAHHSFEDLLPRKTGRLALVALIITDYFILGFLLRTEIKPGTAGWFSILFLYLLIVLGIRRSMVMDLDLSTTASGEPPELQPRWDMRHWFAFCAAFGMSTLLVNSLPAQIEFLFAALGLALGVAAGVIFTAMSIRSLFKKNKVRV